MLPSHLSLRANTSQTCCGMNCVGLERERNSTCKGIWYRGFQEYSTNWEPLKRSIPIDKTLMHVNWWDEQFFIMWLKTHSGIMLLFGFFLFVALGPSLSGFHDHLHNFISKNCVCLSSFSFSICLHRSNRLTQCCTQFKSPGVKLLGALYLHYNVAFAFKWYGNSWSKTLYSQRVWIAYNIELADLIYSWF